MYQLTILQDLLDIVMNAIPTKCLTKLDGLGANCAMYSAQHQHIFCSVCFMLFLQNIF